MGQPADSSMPVYIHIIGDSETDIWGLSGRERLQRMLKAFSGTRRVDNPARTSAPASTLLLRGDYLFDAIVLGALIKAEMDLVLVSEEGKPVAVRISGGNVQQGIGEFARGGEGQILSSLPRYELKDLDLPSLRQNLKKRDAPYVLPISRNSRCNLESELFERSYKGVTDFVTKWLWPTPAFRAVHLCIRAGLSPNHITLLSLLFAVLAGIAFWYGFYGSGLVMGWFMTFLDTVDGKLARVTVTSSHFGDVLDHGLDIIHPPLWYMAWGMGLSADYSLSSHLPLLFGLILIGYIGGRLCEGAFQFWVASFDIFIWRPLDSFNRLITARRNPNLVLLTFGWLAGRPDIGLLSVVIWHLLSTGFLLVRVAMGWLSRRSRGPLHSWFEEIVAGRDEGKLAVRIFAPLKSHR